MVPYQQIAQQVQGLEGMGWQALGGILSSGKKPKIPGWPSFQESQQRAITGNIAAFQPASELAEMTNQFNQEQLLQQLRAAMPGYDTMVSRAGRNISSQLAGEIPADVAMQVNRKAAAASLSGGYGTGGMARNLEARDLGLTSYGIAQQGLNSAMQWIANSRQYRTPETMDITSMFITPQQQGEWDVNKWQRDLLAAGVAAMPDPRRAAIGGAMMNYGGYKMSSAFSGGGGGGGGGMMDFGSMFGGGGGGGGGGGMSFGG